MSTFDPASIGRARSGRSSRRPLRRLLTSVAAVALLAGIAAPGLVPVSPASAQAATPLSTPVNVNLDNAADYFAVVSSSDGALEVLVSGTTASPNYPVAATCSRRVGTVADGTQCFTSNGGSTLELGFRGTGAEVRAALASLTFTPNEDVDVATAEIAVSVEQNPEPGRNLLFNPSNGHFYQVKKATDYALSSGGLTDEGDGIILALRSEFPLSGSVALGVLGTDHRVHYEHPSDPGKDVIARLGTDRVTWRAAKTLAEREPQVRGETGYLATITDQAEMNFAFGFVPDPNTWIGATDDFVVINEFVYGNPTPLTYADQTESEGKWYWVTGPEDERIQFWEGNRGTCTNQPNGCLGADAGPVNDAFAAWRPEEPNNSSGEDFAILNFGSVTATENWNDFSGTNAQVKAFLVEFGPFDSEEAGGVVSLDVVFTIPELLPRAASAASPTLVCTPDPVAPGALVTCEITGGDSGIDILWNASFNGVFAGQGVTLDDQGRGTFTFTAPRAAAGQSLSVVLVEWTNPISVAVTGQALPASLPAGEGSGGVPALPLMLAAGLLGAAVWRLRGGAAIQTG